MYGDEVGCFFGFDDDGYRAAGDGVGAEEGREGW